MGNMGDLAILLVGIVDALFAFFVVAPILLNPASLFGVQKRFAQAMVEEGVIDADTVKQMQSKKQIAGVLISLCCALYWSGRAGRARRWATSAAAWRWWRGS